MFYFNSSGLEQFFYTRPPTARAESEDPAAVAAWMDAWMSDQKATVGNLHLARFVEPIYYLLKPTTWLPDKGQEHLKSVIKLLEAAQKCWRRLDGHNQLPKLILGVTFNDGIEVIAKPSDRQPKTAAA
jgi:hypothetical protein